MHITKKVLILVLSVFTIFNFNISVVNADNDNIINMDITAQYGQTEARSMLSLINDFRTGNDAWQWNEDNDTKTTYSNLSELTYDYELEKKAMKRAMEIAIFYSHTRPNGESCFSLTAQGRAYGENIAAGYGSAAAVFKGWQEADDDYAGQGHRRSMLNPDYTAIGIGHVYFNGCHYWVQEFSDTIIGTTKTSANDSVSNETIEVLSSNISSMSFSTNSITVAYQESVTVPNALTVRLTETWPSTFNLQKDYTWINGDSSLISISEGKIKGLRLGTTYISTEAYGKTFKISVTVVKANQTISSNGYSGIYDGKAHTITISGEKPGSTIQYRTSTSASWSTTKPSRTAAGTTTVYYQVTNPNYNTVTGNVKITINKKATSKLKITGVPSNKTYTGKAIKPTVTVKDGSKTLKKGTDYTVTYGANKNPGKATIKITGKGNYSESVTKTFYIIPKAPTSVKLKAAKKSLKVSYKKATGATGYQIAYSTKKSSGFKTVTTTAASKTISKLQAKKKYYVKVRAYKTIGGKKYYSSYTSVKSLKTK